MTVPNKDRATKKDMKSRLRRFLAWVRLKVRPGFRMGLGALIMLLGLFGFLPVLGFWMIPLGFAVACLDMPWLRQKLGRKKK